MESETPVEPAKDGAGEKVLFTGGKTAEHELDVYGPELADFDKN